ncbi:sulfatase-like hydrolase/transferase [Mangrovibacterium sp.]|uniref:sulfatase-like hydrolase/transferase n=1 Tax=Mangrovibacterium sp. TaxID=1961364 RepID=UPI0035622868
MNKMRIEKYIILLVVVIVASVTTTKAQQPKPNFIIILADDLGFGDLSLNGSSQIPTPNIDRLAQQGVNFTNGYVSGPVCSPSRAGIITGRNQVSFGHDNNLAEVQPGFDEQYNGLPLTETTIASRLKSLGYTTGLIGKWHLGNRAQFHPLKRGFDEYWGYTGGGHDYFVSKPDGEGYECPIECNYKTPEPLTYITDDKGSECIQFIERHKKEPFFLLASFNAPHAPMQATADDLRLFDHIKEAKRRNYCAMVHRLDVNVGRIMQALNEQGLAENTLVVFLSDNGGPCDQNESINAPFNGQKGILLEGGIHVPFIMQWKGELPAGTSYENPVWSLDLAASFFELAGGTVTENVQFDGVNLMPFLLNEKSGQPHQTINWRFTISAAIREGNWKLVRLPDRLPLLFDLSTDISEQNNVALQNIDITESLLKKLGHWDVAQPHPVFLEGAVWKKRQLQLYDRSYLLTQPENK